MAATRRARPAVLARHGALAASAGVLSGGGDLHRTGRSGRGVAVDLPTTTVVPAATSTTPLTEVQQAVLEQVGVTESAYDTALRNPDDPSLVTAIVTATAVGSPAREEFVGAYEVHSAEGHWTVPDPDVPNSVTAVDDPLTTAGGAVAFVTVCHVSGDTLMGRDTSGESPGTRGHPKRPSNGADVSRRRRQVATRTTDPDRDLSGGNLMRNRIGSTISSAPSSVG